MTNFAGLKVLATERRAKLDDALKLFMLNRKVDELEQWITEREVIAGSHKLGKNYKHVTLLVEIQGIRLRTQTQLAVRGLQLSMGLQTV